MFNSLHTRLLVQNFRECLTFYRDVLGFPVTLEVEGDVYAELDAGGSMLSIYRREFMAGVVGTSGQSADSAAQDRVALILAVANVDLTYATLVRRGVVFVQPPADQAAWVLRTAYFRDPDGNLIEINHNL